MLTKEIYTEYRNKFTNQISPEILHQYYTDHNKKEDLSLEADEFHKYFSAFINSQLPHIKNMIIDKVLYYFDKKFEVTKIEDEEGKILQYI